MRYCWFKVALSALIGLSSYASCNAAPTGATVPEAKVSAHLHPARTLDTDQALGQPIDMAWEAWILTDKKLTEDGSNFESSTVPRRITSKSVFLPPSVNKTCDSGYRLSTNDTCVPIIYNFNKKSHFTNFILKRLENMTFTTPAAVTQTKGYHGPVQVGIPLSSADNRPPPSSSEKPESDEDSVEIAVVHQVEEDMKTLIKTETELTVYLIGNGTKSANTSETLEEQGTRDKTASSGEFVEDGSQSITEVIKYQIPIDLGHLLNGSQHDENAESYESEKNVTANKTQTIVLLLAPAGVTLTSEEPPTTFSNEESLLLKNDENGTANSTDIDGVPVKIDGPDSPSVDTTEEEATTLSEFTTAKGEEEEEEEEEEEKEATTSDDDATESSTISFEDEESMISTTLEPEEDQEELLTHSEAGMLVSPGNLRPAAISDPGKEQPPAKEQEEVSQISSEASIRGDVILETTLLDLHATPKKPDALSELFDAEPEVVFSLQDDRHPDPANTEESKDDSSVVHRGLPTSSDAEVISTRKRTTSDANQGRVRFPDDRSDPSSSYVLFPGDNSNSINGNLAYKKRRERISSPFEDATTGVTPGQPDQRNSQWTGIPAELGTGSIRRSPPQTGSPASQRQMPMLLRFWTRMPLIRDPNMIQRSRGPSSDLSLAPPSTSIYRDALPRVYPGSRRVFNRNFRGPGSPSTVQRIG